jgi:hypothetical protein
MCLLAVKRIFDFNHKKMTSPYVTLFGFKPIEYRYENHPMSNGLCLLKTACIAATLLNCIDLDN